MPARELPKVIEKLLTEESDRVSIAKRIAEAIRGAGPYRWTGIYDVNIERGVVSTVAWSSPSAPEHPTFRVSEGLTSRAIAGKKTVNAGNVAGDPDYLTALASTRSEIIVPVLDNRLSRVVGTIDIESERPNAFDSAAENLIEECAVVLRRFWRKS